MDFPPPRPIFNFALSSKTEELYKGIVRRDSLWDKLVFWSVRHRVGAPTASAQYQITLEDNMPPPGGRVGAADDRGLGAAGGERAHLHAGGAGVHHPRGVRGGAQ